jgi:hypothetical protein
MIYVTLSPSEKCHKEYHDRVPVKVEVTLRLIVSQYVLVSSTLGPEEVTYIHIQTYMKIQST